MVMARIGQARLLGRPRKRSRFDMEFGVDDPEKYEYAQDTKFASLADDIAADPAGRGRVRPVSPLMMRPAPAESPDMAFTPEEVEKREAPRSPLAMYAGRNPAPTSPWNVQVGEATITREPPAPPEPAPEASASGDTKEKSTSVDMAANAAERPDYGRVTPETIEAGTAGDAPQRGDKWLAGLRGVGSVLMAAGGNSKGAMQEGMNAYRDYQAQEADHRDWTERNANLARDAAKEQRGENRYADETNYGRARDEDETVRYGQERTDTQAARDALRAEREADRAYERDPARRQESLDDYRAKKRIDLQMRPRGGSGAGRANAVAQFDAARQRLIAKRGGEDKLTDEDRAAIAYAANDLKDPGGTLNSYVGKDVASEMNRAQARGDKQQVFAQKAAAAGAERDATIGELERNIALVEADMKAGKKYQPQAEPLLTGEGIVDRTKRGLAMTIGSDERGSTGLTQGQAVYTSSADLLAQGMFHDITGQTANMAAERAKAEARLKNDGTLQGLHTELTMLRDRLKAQRDAGAVAVRDANGNLITPEEEALEQAPAAPQAPQGYDALGGM